MRRRCTILSIRLLAAMTVALMPGLAQAQQKGPEILYSIDFNGLFDNREFKGDMVPQTIYGTSLLPQLGLRHGNSTIMAGVLLTHEFGSDDDWDPRLVAWYSYEKEAFGAAFGIIPHSRLQRRLPDVFLYDSIAFFNPYIEGTLFTYTGENLQAELYCNWYSRQTYTEREAFRIVTDGEWNTGSTLGAGWYMALTHYAKTKTGIGENLYEKMMAYPYMSIDLTGKCGFADRLSLKAGVLASFIRNRGEESWHTDLGLMALADMRVKRFTASNSIYAGESQLQFMDSPAAGMDFHRADPFYREKFIDKLDLGIILVEEKEIKIDFAWRLNFTEGYLHNEQFIRAVFNVDGMFRAKN